MKQLLCCMVNPIVSCRCDFSVCEEHKENVDHKCPLRPLKKGRKWDILYGNFGDKTTIIGQGPIPCGRSWSFGNLSGSNVKKWEPRPTSHSAMFLKVIQLVGKVKRNAFYDSSMISNLSSNKAGFIRHIKGRYKGGYVLTAKGKKYLATHEVKVDVKEWMDKHSALSRYVYNRPHP